MSLTRDGVDQRFRRMRARLFFLVEGSLDESKQEGFKKTVRDITQNCWKGILKDAGLEGERNDKDKRTGTDTGRGIRP